MKNIEPQDARGWLAPAKLNLFLHITGRREDGYHLLQTLFQLIDLCDELHFSINETGQIGRTRDEVGVSEDQDLSLRAARLLQRESGVSRGVDITLTKTIPIGGGLGGGSSDAATTLLALNKLWSLDYPSDRLAELALQLGADVPVFVAGKSAWAEGVGEVLDPVELEPCWYVLADPKIHVSTAEIFADPELTRNHPTITIRDFHAGRAGNDLETIARKHYPEIEQAFQFLSQFGSPRLTGTGACVFLPVEDKQAGDRILASFPESLGGYVAQGLNAHPLLAQRKVSG